ncbi:MAG: roadblock/LC7 domain-containing protein [Candidatus Thorarchaeota archaeon]
MERPDYRQLDNLLEEMNKEGGFFASILSRNDGLLMASAVAPKSNRDLIAAMSGFLTDTAERVREELSLGELKDISIRCNGGKAVFRKIGSKAEQSLILAALMPRKIRYHNRPLGKAATRIRSIMGYR